MPVPRPLFSIESPLSTPVRLLSSPTGPLPSRAPGRAIRPGAGTGGPAQVSRHPPAAGKVRGCAGALTLLTRKPSLSTPSSMSPRARPSKCAVPAPASPRAAPRPLRPGSASGSAPARPPWPASRTEAAGPPGRKSDQVGISDVVPTPPPKVPWLVLRVQSLPTQASRPGVASWSLSAPRSLQLGRAPHPVPPACSAPLTIPVFTHLPPLPVLTRCLPGT